ncbi:Ger(x)C family spore germination protein [Aneurinibacillus sp. REN35]|uniref:Ger(x)C family spore germination protein n=1 Tax=Aneurinibacillus sp. REN35 TaxID=3237286 RepID=UPI003528E7FB
MKVLNAFGMAVLLSALLLGGCSGGDRKVLDDLGVLLTAGYDRAGQNQLRLTCTLPMVSTGGKMSSQMLSVVARSGKDARKKLSYLSGRRTEAGQLKVILFSEEIARSSIKSIIHPLYRDPEIGSMMFVGVVKGKALEAIKADVQKRRGVGMYLYDMLKQEEEARGTIMFRMHTVMRDMETPGRSVAVPYLAVQKQGIIIDGLALFNDSKMSGKLPARLIPIFLILHGINYQDHLTLELDKKTRVTLSFIKVIRNREAQYNPKTKKVTVVIKGKTTAHALDYVGEEIHTKEQLRKLEKQISARLERDGERVIKIMQQAGSDALGLGSYLRAKNIYPEFTTDWWRKEFPKIEVKIKMEVELNRLGMLR